MPQILEAFDSLAEENDVIVIEGAGSPAEINLAENEETYLTFLVRQDTAGQTAAQLASPNRTLTLELQTAAGQAAVRPTILTVAASRSGRAKGETILAEALAAWPSDLPAPQGSVGVGRIADRLQACFAN